MVAEAEDNNLGNKVYERFARWHTCSLCEQDYHGVVFCALGWACWKTYLGRPEADEVRTMAMGVLGSGLSTAHRHEDALVVKEAELSMKRRLGAAEASILVAQSNLASTYRRLGRLDDALRLRQDAYPGYAKFLGEEHEHTIREANNYASLLNELKRFEEAKSLLRRMTPVARRVLCEEDRLTIKMKSLYAYSLYSDPGATLDGLREAVTTLEDAERIARRVFGGENPFTAELEDNIRQARAVLSAREGDVEPLRAAVEAMAPGDAQDLRLSMYLLLVNTVTRSLGLRLDALDARPDSGLVAQVAPLERRNRILLGNGLLRVVELVDERRRRRNVQLRDLVVRDAVEVLHQSSERIPVGRDEYIFPRD